MVWWMGRSAPQKKHFCSQNDNKCGCILIVFNRQKTRTGQSEALNADFMVQLQNDANKTVQKLSKNSRSDQRGGGGRTTAPEYTTVPQLSKQISN